MCPSWRAVPSRASAIARIAAAMVSSSLFKSASAETNAWVASARALLATSTLARSSRSSSRSA